MMASELIERVMTEHWDLFACSCEFCRQANKLGYRPREAYPTNPQVSILQPVDNGIGYEGQQIEKGVAK